MLTTHVLGIDVLLYSSHARRPMPHKIKPAKRCTFTEKVCPASKGTFPDSVRPRGKKPLGMTAGKYLVLQYKKPRLPKRLFLL